jgi:hypothetical protein
VYRPDQNIAHQMQQGASACARTVAILTANQRQHGEEAKWPALLKRTLAV